MAVWLVRAGRQGEQEQIALERNIVAIGWHELPDMSAIRDRDQLLALFSQVYGMGERQTATAAAQVWAFLSIKKGDLVVLPRKGRSELAIAIATGPYKYRTDLGDTIRHTHSVQWIAKDLTKDTFEQDIAHSMGAAMTVCQIKRNNAEERIRSRLGLV